MSRAGGTVMKSEELRSYRSQYNKVAIESDDFFREFGLLDERAYADGAISKKNKELMGLAISVTTRCDECIQCHLDGCVSEKATKAEIIEALIIGVMAGGSITYPNARFAFEMLKEMAV